MYKLKDCKWKNNSKWIYRVNEELRSSDFATPLVSVLAWHWGRRGGFGWVRVREDGWLRFVKRLEIRTKRRIDNKLWDGWACCCEDGWVVEMIGFLGLYHKDSKRVLVIRAQDSYLLCCWSETKSRVSKTINEVIEALRRKLNWCEGWLSRGDDRILGFVS